MALAEWQDLVESYIDWLRKGISIETFGDVAEITTPFLDRHNDHLQVYVGRTTKGGFVLTDEGETIADLISSGLDPSQPRRREAIETVLRGFGVRQEKGRLLADATSDNIGRRVHALVQAMLAVNDMYVLARSRVAAYFYEDVRNFLDAHEVRYIPGVKLGGRSGYDHSFDFLIPRSKEQPDRVVQAITNPSKPFVSNFLFTIADARTLRHEALKAYAFLNDRPHPVPGDTREALDAYEVVAVPWSERDEVAGELAA